MRPVIALFAKAPLPGRVKTRLAVAIGPEHAANLYQCFVRDALDLLLTLRPDADIELHTDVKTDAWQEYQVPRKLQTTGDLGQRMQSALVAALAEGRPAAMLMGADSPGLPASHMRACLASTADVTLGPTADGGYYAIATRRTHPEMFAGVPWSTGQALKATRAACERCGLSTALGEEYFDVDEPGDLARLTRTAHLPRYTAEWIRTNRQDDRLAALLDSSGL